MDLSKPTLKVRVKGPFGRELIYPDCDLSRLFCELLGQKTLTREDIDVIKRLGYEFIAIHDEVIL